MLRFRAKVVAETRKFFDERGFLEVETDVRIAAPAPEVHIDCPQCGGMFLRASPELQMKKLLAAGSGNIYQIGPCFREGEIGSRHNPEFTMLEWYRAEADYGDIKRDLVELWEKLAKMFAGGRNFGDMETITVREAYRKWAGWDPWEEWDQDRFDYDMAVKVEAEIGGRTVFLTDYPVQCASLAKTRGDVAERWEFYAGGMELANAFSELTDAGEQGRRFAEARRQRRETGEADYPIDGEFLEALGSMPRAGGAALGMDRLVAVLSGVGDIHETRA